MHVSPIAVKALADILSGAGHDAAEVLRRCGIAALEALDDAGWLPADAFDRMMQEAVAVSGDPGFGLVAAVSPAMGRHGLLASLVLHAPMLRQAIEDVLRFSPLVVSQPELDFRLDATGVAHLRCRPLASSEVGARFRTEVVLLGMTLMARFLGCGPADLFEVRFAYARPAYASRYERFFGTRLRFEQPHSELLFNTSALDRPMAGMDPMVYAMVRARAEAALAATPQRFDVVSRLQAYFLDTLPALPSMATAAQALNTSERSLRRSLQRAGKSYQELLAQTQKTVAERMLAREDAAISEVAYACGFSSTSCFHRAVRRWTGHTPIEWRRNLSVRC
jgi:AraC-like DNA-binding protein